MSNLAHVKDDNERHLRLIWAESQGWTGDDRHWTKPIEEIASDLRAAKYALDEVYPLVVILGLSRWNYCEIPEKFR